jgi:hypothetical protein
VLTVPSSSATGSFTAIAGNNYAFSSATVTLAQATIPVVSPAMIQNPTGPSNGYLTASNCGSACTFKCTGASGFEGCSNVGNDYYNESDPDNMAWFILQSNGILYCNYQFFVPVNSPQTIVVVATNSYGTPSAPTNVSVTCQPQ